ncbi:hypothetical protein [Geobacillus zalihae]|nr:hypothetical protein [Geobacillus zalihae]QNU24804.1 hypothetical protein IC806_00075 [Geobacillus zalihae]
MSFKAEALRVFIASPSEAEKGAAPHRSFVFFGRSTKFDGNVLQKLTQSN